jgi:EAL domain-containing protein (putative c-di-GMP-specific phosphodiesterase class I)
VVAVNLSPAQFANKNLVQSILLALASARLSPHRLELEVTESILLKESESNLRTLHQLRGLGVRIAMDDFGTGYSSLSYLRKFPFDKIKLDRSFVRDMTGDSDCAAIIRSIAGLAEGLHMTSTAEGVETQDQLERLRAEAIPRDKDISLAARCLWAGFENFSNDMGILRTPRLLRDSATATIPPHAQKM